MRITARQPLAVQVLKIHWPKAATFSAVMMYLPQILTAHEREQRRLQAEKGKQAFQEHEQEQALRQAEWRAKAEQIWERLPEDLRRQLWESQVARYSPSMKIERRPQILKRNCLDELARRLAGGDSQLSPLLVEDQRMAPETASCPPPAPHQPA